MIKKVAILSQVAYATEKPGATTVSQQKMKIWWLFGYDSSSSHTQVPEDLQTTNEYEDESKEDEKDTEKTNEEVILQPDRWNNDLKQFLPRPKETLNGQLLHTKLRDIGLPLCTREEWLAPDTGNNILDKVALVKKIDEDDGKPEFTLYFDCGYNGIKEIKACSFTYEVKIYRTIECKTMLFPSDVHMLMEREQWYSLAEAIERKTGYGISCLHLCDICLKM